MGILKSQYAADNFNRDNKNMFHMQTKLFHPIQSCATDEST